MSHTSTRRTQLGAAALARVEFLPAAEAVELARQLNDELADLIRRRPDRFAALAVLPLRDVEASVAEASRALDDLGLDGVGLLSHYDGVTLGDPRFRPLLEALDRRSAFAFIHPTSPRATDLPSLGLPEPIVEFPIETTRATHSLLHSGALREFPNIRWHLAHAGGIVPALADRLGRGLSEPIEPLLSSLRYDTALSASTQAMAAVRTVAPTRNIFFATDWPFTTPLFLFFGDPQPELAQTFAGDELAAVLGGNVLREMPRLAAAIGVTNA